MATFKDATDREWSLSLTFGSVKRIRETTGVAILKDKDGGGSEWLDLPFDPEKFVAALWCIVDGKAGSVTREQFEDAFDAATYQAASAAFYDAVKSFSPLPAVLAKAYGTGEEMIRRMSEAGSTPNDGDGNWQGVSVSSPPT